MASLKWDSSLYTGTCTFIEQLIAKLTPTLNLARADDRPMTLHSNCYFMYTCTTTPFEQKINTL